MPALGESVTEGLVSRWLKAPGEEVAMDEPLLEVSTDKVDTEIPSPVAGVLLSIEVGEDETAEVGQVLCTVGEPEQAATAPEPVTEPAPEPVTEPAPEPPAARAAQPDPSPSTTSNPGYAFPLTRRDAARLGVDLTTLTPVNGLIPRSAVLTATPTLQPALAPTAPAPILAPSEVPSPAPPPTPSTASVPASTPAAASASPSLVLTPTVTTVIANSYLRFDQPSVTLEVTLVTDENLTARLAHATSLALLHHAPHLNATLDGSTLTTHPAHSFAFNTPQLGLGAVPVLHDVRDLTVEGITNRLAALHQRVSDLTVSPADLSGATFTITDHGPDGTTAPSPALPAGQAAAVAITSPVLKPVYTPLDGAPALAPALTALITVTYNPLAATELDALTLARAVRANLSR